MKRILAGVIILFVTGCAQYSLVGPGSQEVGGVLLIDTPIAWNRIPAALAPSKRAEVWTVDGTLLDSITFYTGIKDGEPLTRRKKAPDGTEFAVFKSDMLPNEIIEIVESTMVKVSGTPLIETYNLRPVTFAGGPGFQFEYTFVSADEVERRGFAMGAVRDGELYLVLYLAARIHYYEAYLADVQRILESAHLQ